MRSSRRLATALISQVAIVALSAVALAPAATTGPYKGKVKGAGPVTFKVSGGKVRNFRASMSVTCVSSSGGRSESYLLKPGKAAKLRKNGGFTLKYSKDKQEGGPFPLYKIEATVNGQVRANSASGTVKVTYYKNQFIGGQIVLISCASGKANWNAKPN